MSNLKDYGEKYANVRMRREDDVLEVTLHRDGGALVWGADIHRDLPHVWDDIGSDPETKVVILTNAGGEFCTTHDVEPLNSETFSDAFYRICWEGKRILQNLLEIEVPMIAAIDGPVSIHSEIPLLCDIVLASDTTVFSDDVVHFAGGIVPGDGIQLVWERLLGPNRARYFFLAQQRITAQEALTLGVVNEVLSRDALMERAWQVARQLATKSALSLRYTRLALTQSLKAQLTAEWITGSALQGISIMARMLPSEQVDIG